MIALHVSLIPLDAASATALEAVFSEEFAAAVSRQPGFVFAHLLRSSEAGERGDARTAPRLLLAIAFESEEQRLAWVGTPAHAEIWPRIRSFCADISRESFELVAQAGSD